MLSNGTCALAKRALLLTLFATVVLLGAGVPSASAAPADKEQEAADAAEKIQGRLRGQYKAKLSELLVEFGHIDHAAVIREVVRHYDGFGQDGCELVQLWLKRIGKPAVTPLIEMLAGPGSRRPAAALLGEMGDTRAVTPLIKALFDHERVSNAAAASLDKLDPDWRTSNVAKQMVPHLIEVLARDEVNPFLSAGFTADLAIREENILKGVAMLPDRFRPRHGGGTRESMVLVMKTELRKEAAIAALGHIGDARAVRALVARASEIINAQAKRVRHTSGVDPVLTALRNVDARWYETPSGRTLADQMLAAMTNTQEYDRRSAIHRLGYCGDPRAVDPILALWKGTSDPRMKGEYFRGWSHDTGLSTPAVALYRIGGETVVEKLKEMVREDPRPQALVVLGHTGGASVVGLLTQHTEDENAAVRLGAARGLGETKSADAVKPLTTLLNDKSPTVMIDAIRALGKTGSRKAVEPLTGMLSFSDSRFRKQLAVLVREGIAAGERRGRTLSRDEQSRYREDARRRLLTQHFGARAEAARQLGDLGDKAAVPALIRALRDQDAPVRAAAADALGKIGDDRAVEPLCEILARLQVPSRADGPSLFGEEKDTDKFAEDKAHVARKRSVYESGAYRSDGDGGNEFDAACAALGRIGNRKAIEPLVLTLSEKVDKAFVALMHIDLNWPKSPEAKRAVPKVIAKLKSGHEDVPESAMMVLALIGDKRAIGPIAEHLGAPKISHKAVFALSRISPSWQRSAEVRAQVPRLIKQLNKAPETVPRDRYSRGGEHYTWQQTAADALGDVGDGRAVSPLIERLGKTLPKEKQQRDDFGHENWEKRADDTVRAACAGALGKIGDRKAVDPLIAALAHTTKPDRYGRGGVEYKWSESVPVRMASIQALGRLRDKRAVKVLLAALADLRSRGEQDRDPFMGGRGWRPKTLHDAVPEALAEIGDASAVDPLNEALSSRLMRDPAARALARLGDKRVVPSLVAALFDGSNTVSDEVLKALNTLDRDWRKSEPARKLTDKLITSLADPKTADRFRHQREWGSFESQGQPPTTLVVLEKIDPEWRQSDLAQAVVSRLHRKLRTDPNWQTVSILGILRNRQSIPVLISTMTDREAEVSGMALLALDEIDKNWPSVAEAKQSVDALVQKLMARSGQQLKDHTLENYGLAKALVRLRGKQAVPTLAEYMLSHIDAKAEGVINGDRCRHALRMTELTAPLWERQDVARFSAEFTKPDSKGLWESAFVVRANVDKADLRPVLKAFVGENRDLRYAAEIALSWGTTGFNWERVSETRWEDMDSAKACVEDMREALKSNNDDLRQRALMVLAALGDARAADAIIPLLVDQSADVRVQAHEALEKMKVDWPQTEHGKALVPVFLKLTKDPSPARRIVGIDGLSEYKDERFTPTILAAMKDEDARVRKQAISLLTFFAKEPRAVEPLLEMLAEQGDHPTAQVVKALGRLADKRATMPLVTLLKREAYGGRMVAVGALGSIRDPRAVPGIIEVMNETAETIRKIRNEEMKGDYRQIASAGRLVEECCRALSRIHDQRAVAPIKKLMDDERMTRDVRNAAGEALRLLKP